MKMNRNNKTDARPGEKGARSFRRSFGKVVLSVFAAVIVALFGATPAFAAELQLPAPDHSKTAVLDPVTGKINITLSVTGKTDASQSKTSANLIVVLDTSGSMDQIVDQSAVRYAREDDWSKGGKYGLVDNSYVQLYELSGWAGYYYSDGHYWYRYTGQRYKRIAGTRLAVAKQALSNLADQLISSRDSTVKIALETFSGNGNKVSNYYKAGQSESFKNLVNQTVADGGTNWADALNKANAKALEDTSTPTYIVFLSDGKPTFGTSYPYGDGTESPDNMLNLNHFINDAVEAANNKPDNVYGLYAIYTGADAADAMNTFARQTNALPNKAAINGSDSTALNNAFNNIVTTIKNSISYTNVKITDSNSDAVSYVLPAGSEKPDFTYKKGNQIWDDAPKADIVNNQVVWDLGSQKLDQGVTYSVSFEVELTQDAYNKAAPVGGQKAVTKVKTNSAATLFYSTIVTKDGKDGTPSTLQSVNIDSPEVNVPTSTLAITKTWSGVGDEPASLTLYVKQDGNAYKTVTMTPDANGNWKSDVTVATGPAGHTYTIDEVEPEGWSKTESTPASGVTFKSLISETKSAGLTNTYKSGTLTLTKKIKGNAANTSDHFTFELNCDGLKNKSFTSGNKTIAFDGTGKATVDLNNDETVTLNNVPAGKTIDITETTKTPNANTTTTAKVGDTSTTFDKDATKIVHATVTNGETTAVVYTNQIDAVADTGISFSFGPQVALLGVAMAGVFGLVIYSVRKNHGREE